MTPQKIHFVGIAGVGMGSLAIALSEKGYTVTGSDTTVYEPMKSALAHAKITFYHGYQPRLGELDPDAVIIGNVVRRDNPEALFWIQSTKPFYSFPEAVRKLVIQDKHSIVIAGTHGKTTTTNWISLLLDKLGLSPSYLIGGVPCDLPTGCRLTESTIFVGEGDEYDSAFFDKGPKFLHYKPKMLVLNNIEFDHADIYRDLAHVQASFEKLVSLLPGDGLLVANYDDPVVMEVSSQALCPIQTVGLSNGAMWRLGNISETEQGFDFELLYKSRNLGWFQSPLLGTHNLQNLISGIAIATGLGIPIDRIRPVVAQFNGTKRRQEILIEKPFLLIDDFAHHPSEVKATLEAIRRRFRSGKLWAIFEPRSATARRNVHQHEYALSFNHADEILLCEPFRGQDLSTEQRLSVTKLVEELLALGKTAKSFGSSTEIVDYLNTHRTEKDIFVVMSNGEFDKIQDRIRLLT